MEVIVKEKIPSCERNFREQIHSFSDFGKLDRTLYQGHRKRLLTNTESLRLTEKPNFERVRYFTRTKRGIKNHGDFLRLSSSSSLSNKEGEGQGRRTSVLSSMSFSSENCFEEQQSNNERYKVVLFGIPGVGKSSFLQQIRTSEFKGACSEGPEPDCITVPVVLGRKESIIDFVEADMYIQNHGHTRHYDAL
uniref:Uncharacterized protein LOC111132487 n=1 Tax=Crassostrea virginica TaxID=6565 RepID=A0A8B8E779_CRAVI|nr:uncharacterized protein LOC111132487 [Crassostrea virginica]